MKYSYKELPNGYKEVYSIDAKDKKTGIILNLGALILMVIVFFITFNLKFDDFKLEVDKKYFISMLVLILGIVAYMIIHELTHGLFYKIFTKEKLTFGLSWSCAFCGVPNVYVKRRAAVIAALAPFVIYTILFSILIIFLHQDMITFAVILIFALHFGGCVGDLYLSILLLIKYDKDTLINDNGAKQTIYIKEE